jgi:hypothetical protein
MPVKKLAITAQPPQKPSPKPKDLSKQDFNTSATTTESNSSEKESSNICRKGA